MLKINKHTAVKLVQACSEACDVQDGFLVESRYNELIAVVGMIEDHLWVARVLGTEPEIILSNQDVQDLVYLGDSLKDLLCQQ